MMSPRSNSGPAFTGPLSADPRGGHFRAASVDD